MSKHFIINYFVKSRNISNEFGFVSRFDSIQAAILDIKLKSLDNYHLIEVDLETGRHHQIRCQLAVIGSPIKGDLKYGFDRSNKDASIHLHARKIQFTHPVTKEQITILAPTPNDVIWKACE